jgi:hypothetical protein
MGRKVLQISSSFLVQLFGPTNTIGPYTVSNDPIPEDAKIVDCRYDGFAGGVIKVLLESESFPDVPLGEPYPELRTIITTSEGKV